MNTKDIKNLILETRANASDKNCFTFNYGKYRINIHKDYSMWQVTVGDTERLIQLPDDDTVNVFMRGKKIPTYFLSDRAFNLDGDYNTRRWCDDVVNVGAFMIASAIEDYEKKIAAGHYDECNDIISKLSTAASDYAVDCLNAYYETGVTDDATADDLFDIVDGSETTDEMLLNEMGVADDIQEILFEFYRWDIRRAMESGFRWGIREFRKTA